jgi:hypothetical protein
MRAWAATLIPAICPERDHEGGDCADELTGAEMNPAHTAYSDRAGRLTRFQRTRQIHSRICEITSPNSNSAADQTNAETKFAA